MNFRLAKRLIVDFVMTIIMILLMSYMVTGLLWHEILGVVVLVLIIIHNCMNIKWVIGIAKSDKKKLNYKAKISIVLNSTMLIDTVLLGISSVMISRNLFAGLGIHSSHTWKYIHTLTAYLELIMISIHVGMHWKMIMNAVKNALHITEKSKVRTVLLRIVAFMLAVLGVKGSFDREIALKMLPNTHNRPSTENGQTLDKNFGHEKPGNSGSEDSSSDNDKSNYNQKQQDTNDASGIELSTDALDTDTSDGVITVFGRNEGNGHDGEATERDFSSITIEEGETENDFLGKLVCTGCGKQCSLLSPGCGTGMQQAEQAKTYFESAERNQSESEENSTNSSNKIVVEANGEKEKDSFMKLFVDYVPIMGLYIAGTYYVLEVIDKAKSKKERMQQEGDTEE